METRKRVLFVCTHNSARSQMAEGLLRHMAGDRYESSSAGSEVTRVHPLAIAVMAELGVDISTQRSKSLDEFKGEPLDYAITVCDRAEGSCPIFPGNTVRIHWSFRDPSVAAGSEEQQVVYFRKVRDEIRHTLRRFLSTSEPAASDGVGA